MPERNLPTISRSKTAPNPGILPSPIHHLDADNHLAEGLPFGGDESDMVSPADDHADKVRRRLPPAAAQQEAQYQANYRSDKADQDDVNQRRRYPNPNPIYSPPAANSPPGG